MSRATSLHRLLCSGAWDSKTLRNFLECDNSSINEQDFFKRTPLLQVLENSKCSLDIVKILLQYGANVNLGDNIQYTPLLTALAYCRDEAIVAFLLEKGASIHVHDFIDRTPLRFIFRDYNEDYLKPRMSEWKENVLNLLLKAGADLNKINIDGQSPLCYALWEGADGNDIELLLRKGGSLKACMKHASPLLCLTDGFSGAILRANVVELLLNEQASVEAVNDFGYLPLQCALHYCQYETAAIRMLIQSSDVNAVNTWHPIVGNLLHFAFINRACKPSIVNLLLHRGILLNELNIHEQTPLHLAMSNNRHNPSGIEIALKHGAPVNIKCQSGKTPLRLAVEKHMGSHVINLLLAFGANISASKDQSGICLLETALDRYGRYRNEKLDVFKTLVKYYFLENPSFDIQSLILGRCNLEELTDFAEECAQELQRMESLNISPDCTLRKFVSEYFRKNSETDYESEAISGDFNELLRILVYNEFPVYFDVIASKAGKELLGVYAEEQCHVQFMFNYECVCEFTQFLADGDLLRFIVAFYNADNHA